ncbi:MAG: hypothetical protein F9K46_11925 [Anaerolineae bacterium]|nr:MAG: hypothetical protein F9K46_11925 [Anaerolineae bacterium]
MDIAPNSLVVDETYEFLMSSPSLTEIIEFKASETVNERVHYLLDQNSNGVITPTERAELDELLHVDHTVTMLKAKARLKVAGKA